MRINGTEIAILAEALDWLLDTDRTLTGRDRERVERLQTKLYQTDQSTQRGPASGHSHGKATSGAAEDVKSAP